MAASIGGAAIITSLIFNPISALISITVVAAHEIAHGLAANYYGGNWHWTILIPLGIFIVGLTKISNVPQEHKRKVYLMGPLIGLGVACVFLLLGLYLAHHLIIVVAITVGFAEMYQYFFGSDGRKARKVKRDILKCQYL